jgi:hypothetical protein
MEEELKLFKQKIINRYSNGQISKDYHFPRVDDDPTQNESKIFSPEAVYFRQSLDLKQSTNGNLIAAQKRYFSQSFYHTNDGMRKTIGKSNIVADS